MKTHKTMNAYNLLYYTPKLWEKIVLFFCPLRQHEAATAIVWYKTFSNRLYIYGYIRAYLPNSTEHQHQQIDGKSTQGYDNAGNN